MYNEYSSMNVRQKLSIARLKFLNTKIKKTGQNKYIGFKYFELNDIVPTAIRIFAKIGLTTSTIFTKNQSSMIILNVDNISENGIIFIAPYKEIKKILNNKNNKITNVMQALGSSITYLRRYLWLMALDITEPDQIDSSINNNKIIKKY